MESIFWSIRRKVASFQAADSSMGKICRMEEGGPSDDGNLARAHRNYLTLLTCWLYALGCPDLSKPIFIVLDSR